jgi:oligosaccharide repeat unit polymerase
MDQQSGGRIPRGLPLLGILFACLAAVDIATGDVASAMLWLAGSVLASCGPWLLRALEFRKPVAFFVPVFVGYALTSIYFAETGSAGYQVLLTLLAAGLFALASMSSSINRPWVNRGVVLRKHVAWLFTLVSAAVSIYIFSVHGVPILSVNVAESRIDATANGYLTTVVVTLAQAAMVASFCASSESMTSDARWKSLLPGLCSLLLLAAYGNRGFYIFPLLAVAAYLLVRDPGRLRLLIATAVPGVALISIAGFARNLQQWGATYLDDVSELGLPTGLAFMAPVFSYFAGTSEAVDQIILTFPSNVPYPHGSVFFSPLVSWLPGEQPSADLFLKSALGLDFQGLGLAMGATGGFYMDFGPLGVLIGFLILGVISGQIWKKAKTSSSWLIVYAFLISHLWIINYSHPLPYLTTLAVPVALAFCVRSVSWADVQQVGPLEH